MVPILQNEISARNELRPEFSSCHHAQLAVLGDVPSAWVSPLMAEPTAPSEGPCPAEGKGPQLTWAGHQNSETEGVKHSPLSGMWAEKEGARPAALGRVPTPAQ